MTNTLKKEIQSLIDYYELNCSIENFENNINVDWYDISINQNLSENFIKKYKDYVNWDYICNYQNLSLKNTKIWLIGILFQHTRN